MATSDEGEPRPPLALRVVFAGLVLYAAFGKGFAYLGVPPLFVGEALLMVAVLGAGAAGSAMAIPRHPAALLTAALAGTAAVQLAVDRHVGAVPLTDSLRGLAPVTYAGFAFAVYALLRRFERGRGRAVALATVERALARAVPAVLAAACALATVLVVQPTWVPSWPWSGTPVLLAKSTDLSVTLAVLLPVLAARAAAGRRWPLAAWGAAALLVALRSRGALLALAIGFLATRPRPERVLKAVFVVAVVAIALYVSGASVTVGDRQASFQGLADSVTSLLGAPDEGGSDSVWVATRTWRTDWWGAIWSDVREQRMLLHGHGWGDNLAVRYGVVPASKADDPQVLRAPHNIFFSLAGRAGLLTAAGFLLVPVATVVRSLRIRGETGRSVAVGAVRCGLVAAVVVALSDVYLESPQGGVVYWSMVGFLWWASAVPTGPAGDAAPATGADRPVAVA